MTLQWWCAAVGTPWEWSWRPYPGVWLFIACLALMGAWLRRGDPVAEGTISLQPRNGGLGSKSGRGRAVGAVGLVVLWIALDWPIGPLGGGYLASVHMVQFLLIVLVAPPFLLLAVPAATTHRIVEGSGPVLPVLTQPLVAMSVFVAVMAWTHWPPVVDTLMASQAGSFLLDMVWLSSGLVFWWPVVVQSPRRGWFGHPAKMGYLIVATLVNTGVFAYLTYSELPVYAIYELAPPIPGITTRTDQTLAGLLMKMGGAVVFWTWITVLFFQWSKAGERHA